MITPLNSTHRSVVMALERGKLQHLIFDNRVLWHHRALAAVLGVILILNFTLDRRKGLNFRPINPHEDDLKNPMRYL